MHRSNVFLLILIVFIGGVFLGSFVSIHQKYIWIITGVCVLAIGIFFRRDSKILNPKIALVAFLSLVFFFGFARINSSYFERHLLREFAKASANIIDSTGKHKITVNLLGYINSEPAKTGKSQTFSFKSKQLQSGDAMIKTDESVLVITSLYPEYKYGQQLNIIGESLLPSKDPSSQMDYAAFLAKDDIFTLMVFPEIKSFDFNLSFFEKTKINILENIFKVKSVFEKSINRSIAEPNAAFINGILLGSRSGIPDDLKNSFSRTSTTHILAISGFNITIVASLIASLLLLVFKRRTAFWFSIAGIAIFTILTGAQASVARAAVMGCLLLLANKEGRPYGARNAIVFAGALMILVNPNILRYDVGFQLSFMATLGLIYLSPYFMEKFKKIPNFIGLRENMAMTISAQAAVLPLLMFYFNNLSLVSLPVNILILPLVPISMLLGFISGIFGMILPFLGELFGYFAWFITSIQIYIVKLFAKPLWATVSVGFPWYALVLIYAIGLFLIVKLSRVKPKSK